MTLPPQREPDPFPPDPGPLPDSPDPTSPVPAPGSPDPTFPGPSPVPDPGPRPSTSRLVAWEADVGQVKDRHHLRVDVDEEASFWVAFDRGKSG